MFGRIVRMDEATYVGFPILFLFVVKGTNHTDKCLDHIISQPMVGSSAGLRHSSQPAKLFDDMTGKIPALVTVKSIRKAIVHC